MGSGQNRSSIALSARDRSAVLVIDDSEIARERMREILEEAQFTVITLPSPIGATKAALEHRVSLVVCDVNIPALGGQSLVTLFRRQPRLACVKVVLVSAMPEAELQQLVDEVGADAALSKDHLQQELPLVARRLASAMTWSE